MDRSHETKMQDLEFIREKTFYWCHDPGLYKQSDEVCQYESLMTLKCKGAGRNLLREG